MKKITLTLLFGIMCIVSAQAQWNPDTAVNTLVAASNSSDSQSVGTSNGGTYVVFWKTVPDPVNYELRVQLLNAEGVQQFGPDGMLVSDNLPMSTYTVIWSVNTDANDNLYIGATGTGDGTPAFAFKITAEGESSWPGGIGLGTGYLPRVFPLSNGDVAVSWFPGSGKGKIQRYTSEGTAVWAAPVEIIPAAAYSTRSTIAADIYEHSNGDLTTVFHTRSANFGVSSLLFAQRYSAAGTAVWAAPTQLSDKTTSYNGNYSGAQDGEVIYYGYSASHSNRFDSYVQRLNADGTTPWGINGMDFDTNQTNYEMDTRIAHALGSDYVWAIANYSNTSQGQWGEYVQKFDKVTGARQFTDNAKQVFPISNDFEMHESKLFLIGDYPVFIAQSGFDNGATPVTLNAVHLDSDGNIPAMGLMPVATFSAPKGRVSFNTPVEGQAVVVFVEEKTAGEPKVYAQNFDTLMPAEPTCTITTVVLPDITAQCSVELADVTPTSVTDSCGNTIAPTTDESIFPLLEQGTTTITWTYNGENGETATATQNIVIEDTIGPELSAQYISVALVNGQVTVTGEMIDFGSTDNCGTEGLTWTLVPNTFTCENIGSNLMMVTLTDAHGNSSSGPVGILIEDPSGFCTASAEDFTAQPFTLYPNPAKDMLYIDMADETSVNNLRIYSVLGQELYSHKGIQGELEIPLNNLANGAYFVRIETSTGVFTKQVIKAD